MQFAYSVAIPDPQDPPVAVDIGGPTVTLTSNAIPSSATLPVNARIGIASKPVGSDFDDDDDDRDLDEFLEKSDFDEDGLRKLSPDESEFARDLKRIVRRKSPKLLNVGVQTPLPNVDIATGPIAASLNVDQSSPTFLASDPTANAKLALNANGAVTPTVTASVQPHLRLQIPIQSTVSAATTLGLLPSASVNINQSSPTLLTIGSALGLNIAAPTIDAKLDPSVRLNLPIRSRISTNAGANVNLDQSSPTFLDLGTDSSVGLNTLNTNVALDPSVSASLHPSVRMHVPIQSHISANANLPPLGIISGANTNDDQTSPTLLDVGTDSSLGLNTLNTNVALNPSVSASLRPTLRLHVPIQTHITANTNILPLGTNVNLDQSSPTLLDVGTDSSVGLNTLNTNEARDPFVSASINPSVRLHVPIQTRITANANISPLPVTSGAHINADQSTPTFLDVGTDTSEGQSTLNANVALNPTVSASIHPSLRLNVPLQSRIVANANLNVDQSSPTFLEVGSDPSVTEDLSGSTGANLHIATGTINPTVTASIHPSIRLHVPIQTKISAGLSPAVSLNVDQSTPTFLDVGADPSVSLNSEINGATGTGIHISTGSITPSVSASISPRISANVGLGAASVDQSSPTFLDLGSTLRSNVPVQAHLSATTNLPNVAASINSGAHIHISSVRKTSTETDATITQQLS